MMNKVVTLSLSRGIAVTANTEIRLLERCNAGLIQSSAAIQALGLALMHLISV